MSVLRSSHLCRATLMLVLSVGLLGPQARAQTADSLVEQDLAAAGTLAAGKCNWKNVEQNMEYPTQALRSNVNAGDALIHGTIVANGKVAVNYIETTDPVFNEAAFQGVSQIVCNLPAGTPIKWPVAFSVEDENGKAVPPVFLPRPGTPAATDPKRVLILLPQGIDPSNDHDGLNDLSRRLTSALGARLAESLQRRGVTVIGVLDQRPVGIQEKLEAYAGSLAARHILVVTVETVPVDDEDELRYRVQYSDDDLIIKSGRLEAVVPTGTMARTYKIKGSKTGPARVSTESVTSDFLKGLDDDGRLKGLIASH